MIKKGNNYLFSADLLRAIAIIMVVIIHVFGEYVNFPRDFLTGHWWAANLIDAFSRSAVPLFIMLSGMLLLHEGKADSPRAFFKKRLYRLGIPVLFWPIFYTIWRLWLNHLPFSVSSFLADYISLSIYYHLYFLYVILGLYLLTPPLKIFIRHASENHKKYLILLTFSFSILIPLLKYFFKIDINVSTILTIFLLFIPYYLAGDYLREKKITKTQIIQLSILYVFISVATAIGNAWYMRSIGWSMITTLSNARYDRYFYDYLSITTVIQSLIGFVILSNLPTFLRFLEKERIQKFVLQLASSSFGIYLIHPFLLEISNRIFLIDFDTFHIPIILFLFFKTATILTLSYLLVTLCRYIPGIKRIVT